MLARASPWRRLGMLSIMLSYVSLVQPSSHEEDQFGSLTQRFFHDYLPTAKFKANLRM